MSPYWKQKYHINENQKPKYYNGKTYEIFPGLKNNFLVYECVNCQKFPFIQCLLNTLLHNPLLSLK